MPKLSHVLMRSVLLAAALSVPVAALADRTWTDIDGRKVKASLVDVEGESVHIRLSSGRVSDVPLKRLSESDLAFVREWKKARIKWPAEIDVSDTVLLEEISEDIPKSTFVYQTKHFRFHSDRKIAKSLIKDFSLTFEATFACLNALPLNLELGPPSDGHFTIWLYGDRRDYWRAGGPVGTAGVYIPIERRILIPMELLNLKKVGSELRKESNSSYDNSTLIHEITHQVMHNWLKHLPVWMIEGIAEYMSALPYANGKFKLTPSARKNGLKAALNRWEGGTRQTSYPIRPAQHLFGVSSKQWNDASDDEAVANYASSLLFVYYFMHIQSNGGLRLIDFISDIRDCKKDAIDFIKRYDSTLNGYLAELKLAEKAGSRASFLRQDLPAILEKSPDTHIYRKGSPHRVALEKLLGHKSIEDFHHNVVKEFKEYGIRLR